MKTVYHHVFHLILKWQQALFTLVSRVNFIGNGGQI